MTNREANYSETTTTKNVRIATVQSGSPVAKRFKSLAKMAGLWARVSHGGIWVRPEDEKRAEAIYKMAL